ncbi:MAG: PhnB protein [Chlamydiales bacterium]|jgi:PhnB protein
MSVAPIPDGFHTVTPYLTIVGATELLDFVKQAFEAIETESVRCPDGRVQHAQVTIGDSPVMMGEAPADFEPMPSTLYLYVDDVDAWYTRAIRAGGTVLEQPEDKFYGDRTAAVKDSCGNRWYMATHFEDAPPDELARRAQSARLKQG